LGGWGKALGFADAFLDRRYRLVRVGGVTSGFVGELYDCMTANRPVKVQVALMSAFA